MRTRRMHQHRSNALRYASAASAAHSRVYSGCAAETAVSEASGPRVSECIRAPRSFRPFCYPVYPRTKKVTMFSEISISQKSGHVTGCGLSRPHPPVPQILYWRVKLRGSAGPSICIPRDAGQPRSVATVVVESSTVPRMFRYPYDVKSKV